MFKKVSTKTHLTIHEKIFCELFQYFSHLFYTNELVEGLICNCVKIGTLFEILIRNSGSYLQLVVPPPMYT